MLSHIHSPNITFFFQVKRFTIAKAPLIRSFIHSIFLTEDKYYVSLVYVFCTDAYLLNINQQFLQHTDYTDIVTFNLASESSPFIGECYISIDRVKENAKLYHSSTRGELLRVMFHGALHLCGYTDKTPTDILAMRSREDHYLRLFSAL